MAFWRVWKQNITGKLIFFRLTSLQFPFIYTLTILQVLLLPPPVYKSYSQFFFYSKSYLSARFRTTALDLPSDYYPRAFSTEPRELVTNPTQKCYLNSAWERGSEDKDKAKWMICKYFLHSFQRVPIVFVLSASISSWILIFRRWPIEQWQICQLFYYEFRLALQ